MRRRFPIIIVISASTALGLLLGGCSERKGDPQAEAPPAAQVERVSDASVVKTSHPEQFKLVTAIEHNAASSLNVTGVVSADVTRTVPVVSLSSGRVVEVRAKLGDEVKKGQLLLKVRSADISSAYSEYHKAAADEQLARTQLNRAQLLYTKGAIAQKDLELAEDVENKAKVDVETAAERLRVLGATNMNSPSGIVEIHAPISGYIIEQNVTNAAGVKSLDNSPNLFTIADLSHVWIICDVYQNDLPKVHMGEYADVHLDAYPTQALRGRISDIGPVLDPNLRTAKVRLELPNPGRMRVGMFVTATFHGKKEETHAAVPASAVLHLHDREWVYVSTGNGQFQRVSVNVGDMLPGNVQEILAGLQPGQQVVQNALELQSTVEQ